MSGTTAATFPIVLFEHPAFLGSQSMLRFAAMLAAAFEARGHPVQRWAPRAVWHARFEGTRLAKWAGYVDQYLLFPREVRARLKSQPPQTLFVFCDQALGPWVPLVADRPHVVHCHDLLALRSALGEIEENPTRWTGRIYQRWIRAGFRHARHFIAVSSHSAVQLQRHLTPAADGPAAMPEVVYNGLDPAFRPIDRESAAEALRAAGIEPPEGGFLLHVGGGQWYKNREGLMRLYAAFVAGRAANGPPPPLWLVGPAPDAALQQRMDAVPPAGRIEFHVGLSNETLAAMYSLADAFVFPSLAEGFGWPIAEALACGCPVLTTGEAPMTEVGGDAATYLPRMKRGDEDQWAAQGASVLAALTGESPALRQSRRERGLLATRRFEARAVIDAYQAVYRRVQGLPTATSQSVLPSAST